MNKMRTSVRFLETHTHSSRLRFDSNTLRFFLLKRERRRENRRSNDDEPLSPSARLAATPHTCEGILYTHEHVRHSNNLHRWRIVAVVFLCAAPGSITAQKPRAGPSCHHMKCTTPLKSYEHLRVFVGRNGIQGAKKKRQQP